MILRSVLLLVSSTVVFATTNIANHCCGVDNKLVGKKCASNESIRLNCTHRFLLDPSVDAYEQYTVNDDGSLSVNDVITDFEDYCLTKLENDNEVAIICIKYTDGEDDRKWYGVRTTCVLLSVFFILATLTVYFMVRNLRDLQGLCIMHALASLAASLTILGLLQLNVFDHGFMCTALGFVGYFTFMCTFFWLNVTSFHIWKTVVYPDMLGTEKQWHAIYIFYGYGLPAVLLMILAVAHHVEGDHLKPGIGRSRCWFEGNKETWLYFYGPISVLLCINLVFFIWSIMKLLKTDKNVSQSKLQSLRYKVRLYVKLFFIMGLTWLFEVISVALEGAHALLDNIWIVTDYINALQGVLIFLLLVVFRKRALRGLSSKWFCCILFPNTWNTLQDDEITDDEEEGRGPNSQI